MTTLNDLNQIAERPVFLVGAERSGTTLLRLLLSHHPQLAFHYESGFIVQPFFQNQQEPVGAQLRAYQDWLRTSEAFCRSGFTIDESLPYRELVRSFLRQKAIITGKPHVGMTIHKGFEWLPQIWPQAKYIHLIRDGRDVAHSAMKMGWYGNVWAATARWKEAVASYERLTSQVPPEHIITVRFEDLTSHDEGELKRICEFLGLSYDSACFNYTQTSSYERPARNKAANWREKLSKKEIQLVEAEIGDILIRFGYQLSDHEKITITEEQRKKLERENKIKRRKQRIERYGYLNLIMLKIGEKYSISILHKIAQTNMRKIARNSIR